MTKEVKKRAVKVTPKVLMGNESKKYLDKIGFKMEWLDDLAKQYKFDSYDYVGKFCAFRCNKDGKSVEWIDVNSLALLNGQRKLCEIKLKHQPLGKTRKIIDLPWEKI
tara:strand:- start:1198 stop:1521 length:324 start_codon:yes stop_codon:yes gene_type:complete